MTLIAVPGAFADFFEGSGLAQGTDCDTDPDVVRLAEIWTSAQMVRRCVRLSFELPADAGALRQLQARARDFLETFSSVESTPAERAGARKVWERCEAALKSRE